MTQSIHNRAVLVGLRISSWSAKKYDKQVSADAAAAHGAGTEAGRYNKNLLPSTVKSTKTVEKSKGKGKGKKTETIIIETNSHKELMAHIAAVRVWVYQQTLAWGDDGWVILPMTNYQNFTDGIRERHAVFTRLLRAFLADYPQLVMDARRILNGMFRDSDYPEDVAKRFAWDIEFKPVPDSDFRVSLAAPEIAALTASAEARIKSAVDAAQADAVKRLFDCVAHIHNRLTATKISNRKADKGEKTAATYRDTLVTNARDLCDVLKRLNIGDDAKLEQFRRETEQLANVEPDTLRDCPDVALDTATKAQSILDAMTATYGKNLFGGK